MEQSKRHEREVRRRARCTRKKIWSRARARFAPLDLPFCRPLEVRSLNEVIKHVQQVLNVVNKIKATASSTCPNKSVNYTEAVDTSEAYVGFLLI